MQNFKLFTDKNEMSYSDLLDHIEQDNVEKIVFEEEKHSLKVHLKDSPDIVYTAWHPKTENFTEFVLLHDIQVSYSSGAALSPIIQILLLLAVGSIIAWQVIKKKKNQVIQNSNKHKDTKTDITFSDIAGNAEAKAMVNDVIQFIKKPDMYSDLGAKMPRGLLFYGPPGTGKTLMAKAIAGEANVPFYAMSGSDFVQMYVGVGAKRVRDLFKKARKSEKAVIFIDEIDAIGKKRGFSPNSANDERDQTLNALLTEMSGFHEREGIVVIGATNRLDTLDEALVRPGRFDRQIEISLPDINARKRILSLYLKDKPLSDDISVSDLAKSTVSFSGALLENLINEAAIAAANEGLKVLNRQHIDRAFYTVIAGAPKEDTSYITNEDRSVTAYHEAGHALMTKLLLPSNYLSRVTIIPSVQGAGGFSLSIPREASYMTKENILANIKVLLAGRASEEIIFGEHRITTGASNDLEKVSKFIIDYIVKYGMDESYGLFSSPRQKTYELSEEDNKYCRQQVQRLYLETKDILLENKSVLSEIAESLLKFETLDSNDVDRILKKAS